MDELIHQAILAIYATTADPDLWPSALQAIADCFADVGAILVYSRGDGGTGVIGSMSLASVIVAYQQGWNFKDIRFLRAKERGYFLKRDTVTDRDVVTEEEMRVEPSYAFLASHGLRYFASCSVSPDPSVDVALSIQRVVGKAPFTDAELGTLAQLGRHVENALRIGIQFVNTRLVRQGLSQALERSGLAAFGLDRQGRVVFTNAAAEALLGHRLHLAAGRLRADGPGGAVLADLISKASNLEESWRRRLLPGPGGSLIVSALPLLAGASPADSLFADVETLLLIRQAGPNDPPDHALIRDAMSLTLAEARLAAQVAGGVGLKQAAANLGVTENTARTVLKRIFSKTGVKRQSELAALLGGLR
jgi:DNA-binding CsgD family transcriptional regulator/PAS domain-containing protein